MIWWLHRKIAHLGFLIARSVHYYTTGEILEED